MSFLAKRRVTVSIYCQVHGFSPSWASWTVPIGVVSWNLITIRCNRNQSISSEWCRVGRQAQPWLAKLHITPMAHSWWTVQSWPKDNNTRPAGSYGAAPEAHIPKIVQAIHSQKIAINTKVYVVQVPTVHELYFCIAISPPDSGRTRCGTKRPSP